MPRRAKLTSGLERLRDPSRLSGRRLRRTDARSYRQSFALVTTVDFILDEVERCLFTISQSVLSMHASPVVSRVRSAASSSTTPRSCRAPRPCGPSRDVRLHFGPDFVSTCVDTLVASTSALTACCAFARVPSSVNSRTFLQDSSARTLHGSHSPYICVVSLPWEFHYRDCYFSARRR